MRPSLTALRAALLVLVSVSAAPSSAAHLPSSSRELAHPQQHGLQGDASVMLERSGSGKGKHCEKTTVDACGDPDYTPPKPNIHTPLDKLPDARPPVSKRRFRSALVEAEISRLSAKISDPALRRIFMNAYPQTLDTTVGWTDLQLDNEDNAAAYPRSYIITGDIEASWLRDSTNQMVTYLPLLQSPPEGFSVGDKDWTKLYRLALGLVYMQSQFVITDPYANSFGPPNSANIKHEKNPAVANPSKEKDADWFYPPSPDNAGYYTPKPNATQRKVEGNDGVYLWESKWEVDSLANFLHFPGALYAATGRRDFVNHPSWQRAVRLALDTLRSQQRSALEDHEAYLAYPEVAYPPGVSKRALNETSSGSTSDAKNSSAPGVGEWAERYGALGGGVYRFQRLDRSATETRADKGFGEPAQRCGMVKSGFRPSDDATTLPFLVPANAYLAVALEGIARVLDGVDAMSDARDNAASFASEIRASIAQHAIVPRPAVSGVMDAGDVYAYEVDGFGSVNIMDDANIPSLLALPYMGYLNASDETYQRTRKLVLSPQTNKWAFSGPIGSGIGGPHVGYYYVWPMSRIAQILTTTDAQEQIDALAFLRNVTVGTGLNHESQNVYNATDFTRPWFAWVNGLFAEAVRSVEATNPDVLAHTY